MKKILMNATAAGPAGSFVNEHTYQVGKGGEMGGKFARALVKGGYASFVETAVVTPPGDGAEGAKETATKGAEESREWPIKMPPEKYLKRFGDDAKHSALARELVGG